jgi:hypothetical protein
MSHITEALDNLILSFLYNRVKYLSVVYYIILAKNLHRADFLFNSNFDIAWREITNKERLICNLLFEFNIPMKIFESNVQFTYLRSRYDYNTCFYYYLFGDGNFFDCSNKKNVLFQLIFFHTNLNCILNEICLSII